MKALYTLLSHTDLDGVGCGVLAKLTFKEDVRVRYHSVGSINMHVEAFLEKADQNTMLLITDLSVNTENERRLEAYYQSGGKVKLLDHHKTSLHLHAYEWATVVVADEEKRNTSATSLFYQYLLDHQLLKETEAITEFVELVRQYDTWEWEENANFEAARLNSLFYLVSIDEFEEKMVERLRTQDHFAFDMFESKLLDMEDQKIERYIRRKRRELVQKKVKSNFAGIIHAESYHSEVGNRLGKEYPHLDYIVIVNMGARRAGFRTVHDRIDVAEIAARFGGGGHVKAAGCRLTEAAFKEFVVEAFHLDPLHEDAQRNRFNVKKASFGTLYLTREEGELFLSLSEDGTWKIEQNHRVLKDRFDSFEAGESYMKRHFGAWLASDDIYVQYLQAALKR